MAISVILPCYNNAEFLGEALASVFAQSCVPDEIIVVDDGSTDGSDEVARAFGASLVLLRQANAGAPAARNAGIARASGDLIAFLDADDLWPADSLACRRDALHADASLSFVSGRVARFDAGEVQADAAALNARLPGSILFRRSAFDRVGDFDSSIRLGYMLEWCGRALARGEKGGFVDRIVLRRRVHDTNSVHDGERVRADYLKALRAAVGHKRSVTP